METPVVIQSSIVTGFIIVLKALLVYSRTMGWLNLDEDKTQATYTLIDTVIPIVAVWVGAWWVSHKVTSLSNPKDINNMPLSGPKGEPTQEQLGVLQEEAKKVDLEFASNKRLDERRI